MNKNFVVLISFLISQQVLAFTLTDSRFFRFNNNEDIIIDVASDGCSASGGYTAEELLSLAVHGAELYWNTVETANIKLVRGSVLSATANGKDLNSFYSAVFSNRNHIVIGCSSAVPATAAAYSTARGSDRNQIGLVLFKDDSTNFGRSYDTTAAIMAHEMGHCLGLGHTSFPNALMQSSGGSLGLYKLSQDDRDGITYLYPHEKKAGGCLGAIGSIKDISSDDHYQDSMAFFIGLTLILLMINIRAVKNPQLE
ncbi:MAG: hypothetical protein COW00_16810 [Bdellovibrio sp. CG12_big_fil_rev_8_21_14_0_65_39_13]|nr:MAG: hypothetical protein COW78_10100 [Bdellovibrio sp. CG22_combo_CG10-13_8_21_14_all_39_27]PIQ58266.1 MAG: hypothetical protein COW00_16810 [Bdellovibrio sp. CG12_big_fil_rev_8_21_14_0_65_39_13]PIR36675.1 MAG: hypothetical protein COV37_02330 [Bdellovibrio sp. CG11_big_fil_rev_8_21_14_0_20_39_38]